MDDNNSKQQCFLCGTVWILIWSPSVAGRALTGEVGVRSQVRPWTQWHCCATHLLCCEAPYDPVLCLSRRSSVGVVTRMLIAISRGFVRLPLVGAGVFVSSSAHPDGLGAHTWGAGGGGGRLITHIQNCALSPGIFNTGPGVHLASCTMGTAAGT